MQPHEAQRASKKTLWTKMAKKNILKIGQSQIVIHVKSASINFGFSLNNTQN